MLKIYYNNIRCLCLKSKIKKLFQEAIKVKQNDFKDLSNKIIEVSLRYTSEEEIKKINKKYRNIDKKTDVLSFPLVDFRNGEDVEEEFLQDEIMLGDIIICKNVAKSQAKEYQHSLTREICFLALHGFLHLLGFDHIEKEEEIEMQKVAKEILEKNNIKR